MFSFIVSQSLKNRTLILVAALVLVVFGLSVYLAALGLFGIVRIGEFFGEGRR